MPQSSPNDSDSGFHDQNLDANGEPSFVRKLPDGNLLSQILGFSERELSDEDHLQQIEGVLLPVAERHRGEQQLNESITRELVSALLPDIQGLSKPLSEQLIEWVARTLFTDPMALSRLERIWGQLIGRCIDG